MKKTFYFASIATVLAATLLACNRIEEIEVPVDEPTTTNEFRTPETLIFSLSSDANTKSILAEADGKKYGKWETGDKLGSITTKSQGSSTVNADADPVTFAIYSTGGLEVGNTINVWYPYATKQTNPASIPLSIPTEQYQGVSSFDFDAMPMVAETVTVTSEMVSGTESTTPVANIDMLNLGSLLDFKVFSTSGTYSSERVVSINLSTTSAIAGNFTVDLTAVDATDDDSMEISGITETSVTTTLAGPTSIGVDKEHALDVYMVVAPGTYSGTVTVTTDKATYTYALSSKSWARSAMKSFGLDLASAASKSNRTALVKGNYTWVLTEATYSSASASAVVWPHALVTMTNNQGSGTAANNMIPPSNKNDSRFYANNNLSFDVEGTTVEKVLVTTTTDGYASTLAGSTWTNATASASGSTVTIIPGNAAADFSAVVGGQVRATKVQVFFDDNTYSISKVSSPAAGGSFTVKDGDDVVTSAKVNTEITLAAIPEDGYNFYNWTVKDASNNDVTVTSNKFKMPASNATVTANFIVAAANPTITINSSANGTVTATPSGSAAAGTTVTLTITPNTGYLLSSLEVKDATNADVSVNSSYQFTMPTTNVTVTATFAPGYKLTNAQIVAVLSASGVNTDSYGNVTFTSSPGNWSANVNKKSSLTYAQLRNKSGSKLASPTYGSNIDKVIITVDSNQGVSRNIHLIPSSTEVPTANTNYTSTLWESQYGQVASGTGGGNKTITFTSDATSFILVVEGGATYLDEIAVFLK